MADSKLYSNNDVIRDVKNRLNDELKGVGNENCYTEYQVRAILRTLSDVIKEHLENGEKVRVSGIGQFEVVDRPARDVYAPSLGEKVHVDASRKTKIRPAKEIREF